MSPRLGWRKDKEGPIEVKAAEPKIIDIGLKTERIELEKVKADLSSKHIEVEVKTLEPLPPPITTIKDPLLHSKIMLVFKDSRGREKTTVYTMSSLSLHEDIDEIFNESGKKTTRMSISISGDVLEKS